MKHSQLCTDNTFHWMKAHAEFTRQWPKHCKTCVGWGGAVSSYDPSPAGVALSSGSMQEFDPCRDCLDAEKCPRCAEGLINVDEGNWVCMSCGWSEQSMMDGEVTGQLDPPECSCWESASWRYFLEDQNGRTLTTLVKMTEEERENAQAFLDSQDLPLRWHPMEPASERERRDE